MQLKVDDTIQYSDLLLIPPLCRKDVLSHLHVTHLGRDKMLSLTRMLCWWPSFNADIKSFVKECRKCSRKPQSHTKWSPWPVPYLPLQRLHADYCGPFLGTHWALIVEDGFSKFPEVFLTTSPTAEFTKAALQKLFAREGIPMALVTDNGTHFSVSHLQEWLRSLTGTPVFTAPCHSRSNGSAENFVKTLKTAIAAVSPATIQQLDKTIDTFLFQYRNSTRDTTKKTPAQLFKGRPLRCPNSLDIADV